MLDLSDLAGPDYIAPPPPEIDADFWPPEEQAAKWRADAAQMRRELFAPEELTPEELARVEHYEIEQKRYKEQKRKKRRAARHWEKKGAANGWANG